FLRFLYIIGAWNAALIRTLHFKGTVLLHDCSTEHFHEDCSDDLVHSLWLYMPFIKEFCTGLKTLLIDFNDDCFGGPPAQARDPDEPTPTEESLKSLLEQGIMRIRSLRRLEVKYIQNETPEFAKPTIGLVAQRAKARAAAATKWDAHMLKLKSARGEGTTPGRDLCSKDRVSAECWNLCNFCGEFGHFRKGCWRAEEE
ncbi:hypothetical protein BKA61DRAFT_478909, partial [Leptodontidium sp. MPI-SDFR-AT-0119]